MNRPEVQNKGDGSYKHPSTGASTNPAGHTSHKGIMRGIRAAKQEEAEERNANTFPRNRRSHARKQGFARNSQVIFYTDLAGA